MKDNTAIIFLNGRIPKYGIVRNISRKKQYIICADGAANKLKEYRIKPDIIIGDMDSAKPNTLKYYRKKRVRIMEIKDQNTNDMEKCLMYCIENNLRGIIIFGMTGRRQDHTLNNYSILQRYYKLLNVRVYDNKHEIYFIRNETSFKYRKGHLISLIPFPRAAGITTKGLKYILNNETLELGIREGALNKSVNNKIVIRFREGDLIIIKKHFRD
ncbi:MAG: thiamine diphosphokinase [Ignavibacteria bacterium]|nr:thiamine diphosphokinase [Ignavibacteria bacterium]